ncbi:MAG: HD domain-containing protein [Saprospirales bacterium]|nr:MAG: HD domain-containing protein [Saprospirales bacterium]
MQSYKIVNDPIYGFISVPRGIFMDILDHPWFQRLRRISQLGCSHLVYPGAVHTRFHHVMGAFHLMQKALQVLEAKGTDISEEEKKAACLAILLHDLGHGPFSHALEGHLLPFSHEEITYALIQELDKEMNGELEMALSICRGQHPRNFLNQLVASQLDMDRMDYLSRDSFYTGVAEGVISYDRITLMLNTHNDNLVLEEKGIYSLEKFLTARKLMYWQVYLHKTAMAAEKMLLSIIRRLKELIKTGHEPEICPLLADILKNGDLYKTDRNWISVFTKLDDINVLYSIKNLTQSKDKVCRELALRFLNRKLFKVQLVDEPICSERVLKAVEVTAEKLGLSKDEADFFVIHGSESNTAYRINRDEIHILKKDGSILPYSQFPNQIVSSGKVEKHYFMGIEYF